MALVLDTHAVIWYLSGSKQLSPTARAVIESAERNADDIFIASISLVELIYLAERGRIPMSAIQKLQDALKDPAGSMAVTPLDAAVADAVQKIPRDVVQTCRIELLRPPLQGWERNSFRATAGCTARGLSRCLEFASCGSSDLDAKPVPHPTLAVSCFSFSASKCVISASIRG
jgi:PIN domain nuclease of toxin-antitoxin system